MKPALRLAWLLAGALLAGALLAGGPAQADTPAPIPATGVLQAAFAPWDDIESLLVESIAGARQRVLVHAYLLTNRRIARELIAVHRRGIEVQVLVDAEQVRKVPSSAAATLAAAGIPVWLETKYQNAHNKVIVIDPGAAQATVITGSFNFTWTAQNRNAENVLVARNNPPLAARYAANWERHRQEATPFQK